VTDKAPAFTAKAGKAKIDVSKKGTRMDIAVALKNTGSGLASVKLWEMDSGAPVRESVDFHVPADSVKGLKFSIVPSHKKVVPKVKQNLGVELKLKNGEELRSWEAAGSKPIVITPVQTVPKTTQSVEAVTLYKKTPLTGQAIELGLKKPETYKPGAVRISENSLKPFVNQGFELVQSGESAWTLYFKEGKAPVPKKGVLQSSYVLKLELWAEGTYDYDGDGKPIALTDANGNAKTKPAIVKVKVNIK